MIANAAHLPAWRHLADDVELVAVADPWGDRAAHTAARHGIAQAYTDPARMLAEVGPDIVSICTPNCYHKVWTMAALAAGAHVLCEKPVAPGYADAAEMFAAADAAGRLLLVGQSARFGAETLAAKSLAEAGELGEICYAETASLRRRGVPKWGMFHMKEHNAGGPVYDLSVHTLDSLLWIMGNPRVTAVSGQTYTKLADRDEGLATSLADSGAPLGVFDARPYDVREFDVEDFAAGFLRLEGGITIIIRASWAANVPDGMGGTFILVTAGGLRLEPLTLVRNMGRYMVDVTPRVPAVPRLVLRPLAGDRHLSA
jgi:predicted dehydrogenase